MADYPARPSHFAHRFVRLLFKVCAAQQIGPDGVALLTCVAMTEDAARYRRPVTFFNDQLQALLGIGKWERLDRIRRECINAGWLDYEPPPNGARKAGKYFVTIPPDAQGLDDAPVDEGEETIPQTISGNGGSSPESIPQNRIGSGGSSGGSSGGTIVPIPNPVCVVPASPDSLEQVLGHFRSIGGTDLEAQKYHAKRSATGWTNAAGRAIVDWQADATAWHLNEPDHAKPVNGHEQPRKQLKRRKVTA